MKRIKRYMAAWALLTGASALISYGFITANLPKIREAGKVVICHKKADGSKITMKVDRLSLPAHLAHGDSKGACQ